jgi:hypothetical protein
MTDDELRKLAKKWRDVSALADDYWKWWRKYTAAASPSTILYLLDRLRAAEERVKRLEEALRPITDAAHGLSFGTDWNNGTHAKTHGYRKKLIEAIPAARTALGDSK